MARKKRKKRGELQRAHPENDSPRDDATGDAAERSAETPAGSSEREREGETERPAHEAVQEGAEARDGEDEKDELPESPFLVVGLGASAGGLEALEAFFEDIPALPRMAFVVVTHQRRGHVTLLPELLAKHCRLPIELAREGQRIERDRVYIIPPDYNLTLRDGLLHLSDPAVSGEDRWLPIDRFLRSLAYDQREWAAAVILSGSGSDGSLGIREVKGQLGLTLAQAPSTAKYQSMPENAVAGGFIDAVVEPAKMFAELEAYSQTLALRGPVLAEQPKTAPSGLEEKLDDIFVLLRQHTRHDFSHYKTSTLERRIGRRMAVHQITDPGAYLHFLERNPPEVTRLFQELLITVTSFFRDPEAFEALRCKVIDPVVGTKGEDERIRVWVPGCATGEEAYSIAILLLESMDQQGRQPGLQVFATDLDSGSVERARQAIYPEGIVADLGAGRLERFFVREDDSYCVKKRLREQIVFAEQDVIRDPPFTGMDIISCRNLLIYLTPKIQKRILAKFHYALKSGGVLFMGPSENLAGFSDLFEPIDRRWKIFRRKTVAPTPYLAHGSSPAVPHAESPALPLRVEDKRGGTDLTTQIRERLLELYVPPSLVVNERGDLVFIYGRTGKWLEPHPGQPSLNIHDMAREGLQCDLATTMRQAKVSDAPVERRGITVRTNGGRETVGLRVQRINKPEALEGLLVVSFLDSDQPERKPSTDGGGTTGAEGEHSAGGTDDRVAQIEIELRHTRENLRTTIEELETSNEELRSSNEELQSTNEELQSANEELETSKEEQQSLNEELQTVNAELQAKVEELTQTSDDMQNVLNSVDVGALFLDRQLRIKRFTRQVREVVNLIEGDIGRPLSDLASKFDSSELESDSEAVLRTLMPREREMQAVDGVWRRVRIFPYRTSENVIEGIVLTFVDITWLKRAKVAEAFHEGVRSFLRSIADSLEEPIVTLDEDLRVVLANSVFYKRYGGTAENYEGRSFLEVADGAWNVPAVRELLEAVMAGEMETVACSLDHELPGLGRRQLLLKARRIDAKGSMPCLCVLLIGESETGG